MKWIDEEREEVKSVKFCEVKKDNRRFKKGDTKRNSHHRSKGKSGSKRQTMKYIVMKNFVEKEVS